MQISASDFMARIDWLERKPFVPRSAIWALLRIYRHFIMNEKFRSIMDQLKPGDIFVDLGANIGLVSIMASWSGAEVYAYEPDPSAFALLQRYTRTKPNIYIFNSAVYDNNGEMTLNQHPDISKYRGFNQSSSLIETKSNLSGGESVTVQVKSVVDVIGSLPKAPTVIKMDVEGAEGAILTAMISADILSPDTFCLVETHEDTVPGLTELLAFARAQAHRFPRLDLDWH